MDLYEKIKQDIASIIIMIMFTIIVTDYFNIGFDPTDDKVNHNSSGLHYYKDYGTGKEYIGNGTMFIERK